MRSTLTLATPLKEMPDIRKRLPRIDGMGVCEMENPEFISEGLDDQTYAR